MLLDWSPPVGMRVARKGQLWVWRHHKNSGCQGQGCTLARVYRVHLSQNWTPPIPSHSIPFHPIPSHSIPWFTSIVMAFEVSTTCRLDLNPFEEWLLSNHNGAMTHVLIRFWPWDGKARSAASEAALRQGSMQGHRKRCLWAGRYFQISGWSSKIAGWSSVSNLSIQDSWNKNRTIGWREPFTMAVRAARWLNWLAKIRMNSETSQGRLPGANGCEQFLTCISKSFSCCHLFHAACWLCRYLFGILCSVNWTAGTLKFR